MMAFISPFLLHVIYFLYLTGEVSANEICDTELDSSPIGIYKFMSRNLIASVQWVASSSIACIVTNVLGETDSITYFYLSLLN